jgi:hypothetical protein
MDLCRTIVGRSEACSGSQWVGAGYHMIYATAAYVVTFIHLCNYVLDYLVQSIIFITTDGSSCYSQTSFQPQS